MWCVTLIFILLVKDSYQQDVSLQDIANAILQLENSLGLKIHNILEDKMGDLLDEKMMQMDHRFDALDTAVKSMESKMTAFEKRIQTRLEVALIDLKNITEILSEENKISKIQENVLEEQSNSSDILQNTVKCPVSEGFFVSPGASSQCLKHIRDERINWMIADDKCKSEGLVLAKIDDHEATALNKYIVEVIAGDDNEMHTWIGGRADGSTMRWLRDQEILPRDSGLMYRGDERSVDSRFCLVLNTHKYAMEEQPERPYGALDCYQDRLYTLCERISE